MPVDRFEEKNEENQAEKSETTQKIYRNVSFFLLLLIFGCEVNMM